MKMEILEEEQKKIKICDLSISDQEKMLLTICKKPTNIPNLCEKLNLAYSTVNQKVLVLKAKGYIINEKSISGKNMIKTKKKYEA